VRTLLRKEYGFPKDPKKKFGVDCVYSSEGLRRPETACDAGDQAMTGLNCAGFGSAMCVTATFGMMMVGDVLRRLATPK
jgi:tRNA A37 threonylcarbamoyladenosine dehydratase